MLTLALGLVVLVAAALVVASAASLQVDGGVLQVFDLSVTVPVPTPEPLNCTYSQGYWKNHPEAWPVEQITLGGVTYGKAEAIAILQTPPGGDATFCLIHQLIAARLNVLNGADPAAIATTLAEADAWLAQHPLGSNPPNPDRKKGVALAEVLDAYNNGRIGPGHCASSLDVLQALPVCPACTPTPTATATPTPTLTPTVTPTVTATETGTIEPTTTIEAIVTPEATETVDPALTPTETATSTPEPSSPPTANPPATYTPEPTETPEQTL
jgi:hypothetical protein